MGAFYETIPASLHQWILAQHVIWIASAPLSAAGHVNVSPKGGDYFGIIDERTFWYMDLTGSGVETLSHLQEPGNGRITVLLNAFEGSPRIVRLWGQGVVLEYGTREFDDFVKKNDVRTIAGTRAIVRVDIEQVGSSCGFSMPYYDFRDFRTTLNDFFEKKVANEEAGDRKNGIEHYWAHKNALSMDGNPGMKRGYITMQREKVQPIKKMVGKFANMHPRRGSSARPVLAMCVPALVGFVCGVAATLLILAYFPNHFEKF